MTNLRALGLPVLAAVVSLVALWVVGRDANPGPLGFRLDDAWIHMVYGRGLARCGTLAYEDCVPSTGCTSPAWAAVLAGVHAVAGRGADESTIVAWVILTGAALHVAGVVAATSLARRLSGDAVTATVAGALVAIAPPLVAASLSGMEVALTSSVLLAGLAALAAGRAAVSGVCLALAGLGRPESAAVIVVAALALGRTAPPGQRARLLRRFLLPPLLGAVAFVGYDLWASGRPLPATFYFKSDVAILDLPSRIFTAATRILDQVPPFKAGIGWLALAGLWFSVRLRTSLLPVALPLTAAAAFALANLLVLDPVDPEAFYHQRYLWPSAPLLLVAASLGTLGLRRRFPRLGVWPVALLAGAAFVQTSVTIVPTSRHLHNDVRNINEVQRRIGEYLRDALPPGTRIAVSDAGAIRYFSELPTLDVVGMNTPGMAAPSEEYVRSHPVAALALLPAWFRTPDGARLEEMFRAETSGYTVTSNPAMARQVVVRARPAAGAVRARFVGFRAFALDFVPPEEAASVTFRGAP